MHLRREVADLKTHMERRDAIPQQLQRQQNRNICRLAQVPGRRNVAAATSPMDRDVDDGNIAHVTELSKLPKTLHALWQEYEFGSGNRKPAKDFTANERGRVRYKYYKRKFFWHKVSEMIRRGMTSQVACDRIYEVYGPNQSITNILIQLKRDDLDRGEHPALQGRNL